LRGEMTIKCPGCGADIVAQIVAQIGADDGADDGADWRKSGAFAQRFIDLDLGLKQEQNLALSREKSLDQEQGQELKPSRKSGANLAQTYGADFLEFWRIYPRKRDKRKALFAWEKAIRRAGVDEIVAGAERYRDDPNRDDAYTKYAEGWLNGDGWEDEPLPSRASSNGQSIYERLGVPREMR
jgi:hypothetical protein